MSDLQPGAIIVKQGTLLYDRTVECDIRIAQSPICYGTGDYEDPPEIQNDVERPTFYIQYGSTTQRDSYNTDGGGYPSLAEAVAATEAQPGTGKTIRWR